MLCLCLSHLVAIQANNLKKSIARDVLLNLSFHLPGRFKPGSDSVIKILFNSHVKTQQLLRNKRDVYDKPSAMESITATTGSVL